MWEQICLPAAGLWIVVALEKAASPAAPCCTCSCENDDDYAGVAEQMLGLSEKEAVEWIESDSGTSDSDGGRGINGVDPDDSGDYDEDAAHGSEDEDYEDSEEADDE